MARNIEIKAAIGNLQALLAQVVKLCDQPPIELDQDDIFFACANGRLKLRSFSSSKGELIFYRRPDHQGPKESFYLIAPTSAPAQLGEILSQAFGQAGRVRKHRTLFLKDRTRIHIDQVEGLGAFLELEVVLKEGEPPEVGRQIAQELLNQLGIGPEQLIEGAYVDLLKE